MRLRSWEGADRGETASMAKFTVSDLREAERDLKFCSRRCDALIHEVKVKLETKGKISKDKIELLSKLLNDARKKESDARARVAEIMNSLINAIEGKSP